MKKKFDPSIYRCGARSRKKLRPKYNSNWCYQVATAPKGKFIVQVRGQNELLIVGHLGLKCKKTIDGSNMALFPTKESADKAAQVCIAKDQSRKKR